MSKRWDDLQAQDRKHYAERDEARKWARYFKEKAEEAEHELTIFKLALDYVCGVKKPGDKYP